MTFSIHNNSYALADILCQASVMLFKLWEHELNGGSFMARVGDGKATYHKLRRTGGRQLHTLTFGIKMIDSKRDGRECMNWLSAREIVDNRFYNGQVTFLNLMAHVVIHEFGHAIQTARGARTRGSVHNAEFYSILRMLHRNHAQTVANFIADKAAKQNIGLDFCQNPVAERNNRIISGQSDWAVGQPVVFKGRNKLYRGSILKLNPKRAVVGVDDYNGSYEELSVPYSMLSEADHSVNNTQAPVKPTARVGKSQFQKGQQVIIHDRGNKLHGIIEKLNPKRAVVTVANFKGRKATLTAPYGILSAA